MQAKTQILLVDDSRAITLFLSDAVGRHFSDVEIHMASNGEEAFQMISTRPFNLIISDWNMPKMSGRELLEKMKENERTKNIPFIMLTANNDQECVRNAVALGVSAYLLKPFTPDVLLKRISKLLPLTPLTK